MHSVGVQGAKRLCHVILPIFGVILSRRTSSTPLSSALKMGKIPMAEVEESEGAKFAILQGTFNRRTGRTPIESNAAELQI